MISNVFKREEDAVFKLRLLYKKYGYLPYKMSKFEEYDLYANNKDFLVSDRIITFTDEGGKLLALKPDVTLSIIKNGVDGREKKKVYYNENVYRVSPSSKNFKEIMQAGLECIGEISLYDIYETVLLAVKSLETIGSDYVLDISHLGFITAILHDKDENFKNEVVKCVGEKNIDEVKSICQKYGYQDCESSLATLISLYGNLDFVMNNLQTICNTNELKNAFSELNAIYLLLKENGLAGKVRFDFSLTGDINYYNGIVFKGYVNGIAESVLSGGQYDKLAKKISKVSGAVGFAVYLDLLQNLNIDVNKYDVDTVILINENTDVQCVINKVNELTSNNVSVSVQQSVEKLRYKNLIDLRG